MKSYLRDTLQMGGTFVVACLPAPRAKAYVHVFVSSLLVDSTTFFVIQALYI
jgi:hypothetical protein